MLLVPSKCLITLHSELHHLDVVLGVGMSLLSKNVRDIDVGINVTLNIGKLLRQILRVTFVNNLVIVTTLLHLTEVKLFIDIIWCRHSELGQALLEVRMECSWVNKETAIQDVLSEPILRNHTLDGQSKWLSRSLFQYLLH